MQTRPDHLYLCSFGEFFEQSTQLKDLALSVPWPAEIVIFKRIIEKLTGEVFATLAAGFGADGLTSSNLRKMGFCGLTTFQGFELEL
jgi:hypothetical protein